MNRLRPVVDSSTIRGVNVSLTIGGVPRAGTLADVTTEPPPALLGGATPGVLPAPSVWLVVGTAVVGLLPLLSTLGPVRPTDGFFWLGAFGTLIHEAGHAAAAMVTGGGVYTINVDTPDSGVTVTWCRSRVSEVLTTVAGYATPALAGLGAAALLHQGRVSAVLTITVITMVVLLVVARGLLTVVTVVVVGGSAFAALRWGTPTVAQAVAYSLAWLLLISEIDGLRVLVTNRRAGAGGKNDATDLAAITHVPGILWIAGWAALVGWALWTAVPLLWP